MKKIDFIENMATLKIQKDDLIVIKINLPIAAELARAVEKNVYEKLPEGMKDKVGIICIDSAADIGVLRAEK